MDVNLDVTSQSEVFPFLQGGGQMGELIRTKNWEPTSLGHPGCWPQSLRTTISTCLNSRFPILIWWGPDLVMLYNDAYRPILGEKHPASLGEKGKLVWPEIWNIIGPMLNGVYEQGLSTWSENQLLLLNRYGFVEECYFTFSYSPVYDESGGIGGVYCAVTETTKSVLNERQLKTLQDISNPDVGSKTAGEVYRAAAKALAKNSKDFPFGIIYKIDDPTGHAIPAAYIGLDEQQTAFPSLIDLTNPVDGTYNFCRAFRENEIIISLNNGRRINIPRGDWDEEPTHFVHIPIANAGSDFPNAMLSAALNPYRSFDESYHQFATLIAGQVALEINNVMAFEEERRRSEALAEIDHAKTVFFSNISHEFRTPLTLMLGPLQELVSSEASLTPHAREAVSVAHRNTLRLHKLVNTLLDFSRIEAGRMQGMYRPVNIASFTAELAGTFRSAIENAGMQLNIHCQDIDEAVYVDVDMWEKIVLNLVSNAFKYCKRGSIEINLSKQKDQIVFSVSDTGVGIPEQELPHIFERFYRVHHMEGRSQEGTGIGLAMIRELVRLHNGSIDVKSTPGKGSVFTVSIPAGSEHLPVERIAPEPVTNNISDQWMAFSEEAKKWSAVETVTVSASHETAEDAVLIADDNADMRDYLSRLLRGKYNILVCSDGETAFDIALQQQPALIISDVMMPKLDGFALLGKLRAHPSTKNISVMFLSARAGQEAVVEGLQAGADDYLVKPFAANELVAKVDASIRLSKTRKAAEGDLFNLLMQAPVAVAVFNGPQLQVELVNELMLQYWRRQREEVVNHPLPSAWPEAAKYGIVAMVQQVYVTGHGAATGEIALELKRNNNSTTFYLNFVFEPRRNLHGVVTAVMAVANDVTELVMARQKIEEVVEQRTSDLALSNDALAATNNELQRINANLRDFTYAASHDMKEPLRKINYFSDRILQNLNAGKLDNADYFNRMKHAVRRMESLIEDLLSYSRLNSKIEMQETVDLKGVVRNVLTDLQPDIEQLQAQIHVGDLPQVSGYPRQLYQMFENIFSNAIKFHRPSMAPVIRVWAKQRAGSQLDFPGIAVKAMYDVIEVEDEGIGFDSKDAERIFNLFTRLHGNAEFEGSGIGLAIVKKVMENHRGFAFAEGEPGRGAKFVLLFPHDL